MKGIYKGAPAKGGPAPGSWGDRYIIEKEEYQMCRKLYCQIKREVSVDVVWWEKIWWKYWNGISL